MTKTEEITFEKLESLKQLLDHIKSVWTLSAGGLALSVGLLGFLSKDLLTPSSIYRSCQLMITIGLMLYVTSILTGLHAHRKLISAMLNSEIPPGDESNDTKLETDADIKKAIHKSYDRFILSRKAFIIAGILLVATTLFSIGWSSFRPAPKSQDITVLVKNASLVTTDLRRIEVQELKFKLPVSGSWITPGTTIEIKDLALQVEVK